MSVQSEGGFSNDGWWLYRNKEKYGPYSIEVIREGLRAGTILPTDFIWLPDKKEWQSAEIAAQILTAATAPKIEVKLQQEQPRKPVERIANEIRPNLSVGASPKIETTLVETQKTEAGNKLRGRIKFLDTKTRQWGFITPEGGGDDVHYNVRDITKGYKESYLENSEVSFEVGLDFKGKAAAKLISILKYPDEPSKKFQEVTAKAAEEYSHKNKRLTEWAYIPFERSHRYDDETYDNLLHCLKEVSLREKWHFGADENGKDFSLLKKYIQYTFDRVRHQDKIKYAEQDGKKWAVFNTGLVDKVYDPIYMLFTQNTAGRLPWKLDNICIEGKRSPGKRLASLFSPCPPAAKYLESATELIIAPGADILIDDEHVIEDAIEDDRFPSQFLQRYAPRGLDWEGSLQNANGDRSAFLLKYRRALVDDIVRYREIKNRILDAIELAKKRTFWNYKTAIPSYYPKHNQVDLLLPLCLDDRNESLVTVALVVSRNRSGSYQGRTVYPLEWAYERARVVCRPDSDWLIPDNIAPRGTISSEDPPDQQQDQQDDRLENAIDQPGK